MLNSLVDKAIQRSAYKFQPSQPMFTISYASQTPSHRQKYQRQQKNKTVYNQTPKITKKDVNIFQKWKSKTLQKLKDLVPQPITSLMPTKPKKTFDLKQRLSGHTIQLGIENAIFEQLKQEKKSFIVHKKKLTSKTINLRSNSTNSPSKSIYLLYKDEKKNKFNKNVALSHIYQKQLLESSKCFNNPFGGLIGSCQNQEEMSNQEQNCPTKKANFFSTIQYKAVPKQEIRHYKAQQFQNLKRNILNRKQNTFSRSNKHQVSASKDIMNHTISALSTDIYNCYPGILNEEKPQTVRINIRNTFTQKRSRRVFNESLMINLQNQQSRTETESYRPWSPIKTNPGPILLNDDELLFEQSKSFNIFSKIEQIE